MLQCLQRNISNFVQSDTLLNIYIYTTIEHFLFCHNKYSHKILLCGKEKKFFTRLRTIRHLFPRGPRPPPRGKISFNVLE